MLNGMKKLGGQFKSVRLGFIQYVVYEYDYGKTNTSFTTMLENALAQNILYFIIVRCIEGSNCNGSSPMQK